MAPTNPLPKEAYHHDEAFDFIKTEEFEHLGIDPADIPAGTFAARRHPSQLPRRYGGNAYGVGVYEAIGRLKNDEIRLLDRMDTQDSGHIKKHYKELNQIYKKTILF